ncbi:MAG: hypothetical protein N3D20_00385 [Candidatus Pacearchaeota archaeon]|nr:hypothetical protein [Candidatus Pacearchaeota archaeon]
MSYVMPGMFPVGQIWSVSKLYLRWASYLASAVKNKIIKNIVNKEIIFNVLN